MFYFEHLLINSRSKRSKRFRIKYAHLFTSSDGLNSLNDLNDLNYSDRSTEIDFDNIRIFRYGSRQALGDFFAGAQDHDTMREIEQCPDDMFD